MLEMIWRLITGDATAEERKHGMSFLLRTGYRVVMTSAVAAGFGVFAFVGFDGWARAAEIEEKIQPLERKVAAVSDQVGSLVANSLASEIRYMVARKCKEPDPIEKDRLQREIDRKQYEYRDIRKEFYQFGCDDV